MNTQYVRESTPRGTQLHFRGGRLAGTLVKVWREDDGLRVKLSDGFVYYARNMFYVSVD